MKEFKVVCLGQMVSALGSGMTMFALAIYVFQTYGTFLSVSLVTLFAFGPQMLLSLFAGVLSDRYNRLVLMLLGDGLSILGLLVMLVFYLFGSLSLLVILISLCFNSVVGSLLEPSYKALISDMTLQSEYTKASGLVQLSSATKFIFAPLLAGFVLQIGDLSWLLFFDALTFLFTCLVVGKVRLVMAVPKTHVREKEVGMLKATFAYMKGEVGLMGMVYLMIFVTFCVGCIQTLFLPLLLCMASEQTVGLIQSIGALGMIFGSLLVSVYQKKILPLLIGGLLLMGLSLIGLGLLRSLFMIAVVALLLYGSVPFINTGAEVLIRKNTRKEMQGRVWGFLGFFTQLGYIFAYMTAGLLADYVFNPLLMETGFLAPSLGLVFGVGDSRGIGLMFTVIGVGMVGVARLVVKSNPLQRLEESHDLVYV